MKQRDLRESFEEKIRITPGCWEWLGSKKAGGYGHMRMNLKMRAAHIVSYHLYVADMTDSSNLVIRHTCDNPSCVNPDHLIAGTQADNMKDRQTRRRTAKGDQHGRSTVTEQEVREILDLCACGCFYRREIADFYGIDYRTVSHLAIHGRRP